MSFIDRIKQQKRTMISEHTRPDNVKGLTQVLTTLAPLSALWFVAVKSVGLSYWLPAGVTVLMSFFLIRVFVLLHECGHGSLFRTAQLNHIFGFLFGVVSGMPQYVWSQHHDYHHSTNGNWEKYRGPLSVLTVDEYEALTARQQRRYQYARTIWVAPLAGFVYLIFNPRFTWLKGSVCLVGHILSKKIAQPGISIRAHAAEFNTPYWACAKEYWHMFWNNVVLLSAWVLMSWYIGPALFFSVYLISVSLAGAAGIVLFAVQHNFEHSYAGNNEDWDYDIAAIHGSSFLILPRWLNWVTVNIAYHHIHHLSSRMPNYCLVRCHEEYQDLFRDVTRVKLLRIRGALKCILWDVRSRQIISVAEYLNRKGQTQLIAG